MIRYYGCLIKRGHIVDIILDRCSMTLKERLEIDIQDFNVDKFMNRLTSAVHHLHLLVPARNNPCPMNIMIDEADDDTPAIINFGSCQSFGRKFITAGTPGWIDEDFVHSTRDHDEFVLSKIQPWLEAQGRGRNARQIR